MIKFDRAFLPVLFSKIHLIGHLDFNVGVIKARMAFRSRANNKIYDTLEFAHDFFIFGSMRIFLGSSDKQFWEIGGTNDSHYTNFLFSLIRSVDSI